MRYQLIGIDLDGTLLGAKDRVSAENLEAIAEAQAAGALVVPCTGRAWRESIRPLKEMPEPALGVFVTGAAVTDMRSGQSLDLAVVEPHLAAAVVDFLYDMPEAVLVFREAALAGHDYLVTGNGELTSNTQWWFDNCGAVVQHVKRPTAAELHHILRIGLVATETRVKEVVRAVIDRFGDRLFTHYFPAVQTSDNAERMDVLEIFAAGVDKWRGLQWIARQHGTAPARIAVIGDQINDTTMIENAGCGIAMANAVEPVKAVADHVTLDNESHGVAHAIGHLLSGSW